MWDWGDRFLFQKKHLSEIEEYFTQTLPEMDTTIEVPAYIIDGINKYQTVFLGTYMRGSPTGP